MQRLRGALCFMVALLCMPLSAWADGINVVARAPQSVGVGEQFYLKYEVDDRAKEIVLGNIDQETFTVLMGPSVSSSSSTQFVNGQRTDSRKTVFTYILKARRAGVFTIPSARVTVGSQSVESNAINIKVVDGDVRQNAQQSGSGSSRQAGSSASQSNAADIIIRQTVEKGSIYEGEGTQLVTKVYTRVDLNSIQDKQNPKLSEFVVSDMSPQQYVFNTEVLDGVQYQACVFDRKTIIPQKSGKITIEPVEIEFIVKRRVRSGGGGFFDGFFDEYQMQSRRVRSNAITLDVKALPAKPAGFSGGVGRFKLSVTANPTEVEVDNSVTLKVSVEGQGNLKLLSMPKPQFHQDFDTFDPSSKNNFEPTATGFSGRRTDEYLIIPRRDGEFEIPEVRFTYYDLQQAKYVTLSQGPIAIKVNKGEGGNRSSQSTGVTFSGAGPEQVTYTNQDLRYLHRVRSLSPRADFFVLSPLFWVLTFLPIIALVVLFIIYRKKVYENQNMGQVRSRKANKMARKRLNKAAKLIDENKREAFYDEVMRALWGYLSDKLTLPLSVLTKANAKDKMDEHGIAPEASEEFLRLLDECEFDRYAPVSSASTPEEIYKKAIQAIEKIEAK